MKNNKKYKRSMELIKISDSVEKRIMASLEKPKKCSFKLVYACGLLALFLTIGISFAYADEIKECWQNIKFTFSTRETKEEVITDFNYKITNVDNVELDSDKLWFDSNWMTKEQLESDLGFQILKYENELEDSLQYTLWNNNLGDNNLVQGITIYHPNIYEYSPNGKEVTCTDDDICIYFVAYAFTKNASPNDYEEFLNSSILTQANTFVEKYQSDKFGTVMIDKVNTMSIDPETNEIILPGILEYNAIFTYDNIIYAFSATNITVNQLKEIIDNLHY